VEATMTIATISRREIFSINADRSLPARPRPVFLAQAMPAVQQPKGL
jgi:hypothetical protein